MNTKMRSVKTFRKPPPIAVASTSASDAENAMQFELELTWCINSLETALNTGKLSDKVAEHTLKNIKILKSNSTPMIKKRQVMKAACGDYRAIMKQEEKKMALASKQIKFTGTPDTNKSTSFVKKSAVLTSGKDFRFNFNPTAIDSEIQNTEKSDSNDTSTNFSSQTLKLTSGNGFKFNFNIDEPGDINIEGLTIKN